MDAREADLRSKLSAFSQLKTEGTPPQLVEWSENARLALEFRDTDAMIGLDPLAPDLIADVEAACLDALSIAGEAGHEEACVVYARTVWEARRTEAALCNRAAALAAKAAENGDAAYYLGLFAFNGFGLEKDLSASLAWHRKAAAKGHAGAMFELYAMLSRGLGGPESADEAMRWCHKSAEAGNTRAMANLGGFYATGNGVPKNEALSLKWYDAAAKQGHGRAAGTLGIMFALGDGAPRSHDRAKEYFALADEWGFDWRDLAEAQGLDFEEFES